jgi:phenylalanyl-tRNA synthetase beta chain
MKLPISWLKKYIDVSVPAEKLAELLTLSGSKVEQVESHGSESVIEIEVTTNRPDCLSILGLAHEVSAITGRKIKRPAAYASK